MATNSSSVAEDTNDPPVVNSDTSKGSSVSSGMQEEYNELLKYAVVIPKWDSQDRFACQSGVSMPMLDLQQPPDAHLTTMNEYSSSSSSSTSGSSCKESSSARSNDARDSAMGSDEITSDRKTFREHHIDAKQPRFLNSTVNHNQSSTCAVDPDAARMFEQLQMWNNKFNNMVLAEFSQAKMSVLEHYRRLLHDREMAHQAEVTKLQDEIENMKELLHTYETSLNRKDCVISNLTRALQINKEKQEMLKVLSTWKLRLNDERRQVFATCLARRHRERVLAARAWNSWRALVEGSWRERVEKACQMKAREVCMQLTDDYEKKLASLNNVLASSRAEIKRLHEDREKYEETMKKAFMRGVCALNLEAMSMFQNEDGSEKDMNFLSTAVDALSCSDDQSRSKPSFGIQASRPQACSQIQPATVIDKTTTVFSQHTNNLPVSNPAHHNADVVSHARNQVLVNSGIPPQQAAGKRPTTSTFRNATSSKVCCMKAKPPPNVPASIVVKRHHPNLQNHATQRPLKHLTKYPNTPVRPIAGKQA